MNLHEGLHGIEYTQSGMPVDICWVRFGFHNIGVFYAVQNRNVCTHDKGPWVWNSLLEAVVQIRKWR